MRPRETSVSCPWAASLQQGDVISKVIVLMAQAAEAAPLAHHEAERQHEEGADGRHDVGYGHEGRLVCLWDVVATVFHVWGDKWAFHRCRPELIVHMTSTDSKADSLSGPIKDDVEALHDHSSHHSARGGL